MLAGIMSEWEVTTTVKISELFDLKKSQYELDFVDINPDIDTPLFLDPYYISKCEFPFAVNFRLQFVLMNRLGHILSSC